jgi:hypothetical protein
VQNKIEPVFSPVEPVCRITVYILGANLLEAQFVLSFNHQNPQSGLIALTGILHKSLLEHPHKGIALP